MDEKNPDIIPENPENNTFEDDFVIGKGFEISEEPIMPEPKNEEPSILQAKTHLKTLFGFFA